LEKDAMRILLVNTYHYRGGGDSTYTINLADLLRSKGHSVAFFAMQDERNFPDPNADLFVSHIDFRELSRQESCRRLRCWKELSTRGTAEIRSVARSLPADIVHRRAFTLLSPLQ
jgi:hypothetical protein